MDWGCARWGGGGCEAYEATGEVYAKCATVLAEIELVEEWEGVKTDTAGVVIGAWK